jgi:hypothetical protein
VTKEDDVYTSDSDDDTDSSGYYDSESNQLKQIDCEDEFADADLEELVNSKGPQEMLRLMLQKQGDEFMMEEVTDSDDYADWIRWVSDAEQSRQVCMNPYKIHLSHCCCCNPAQPTILRFQCCCRLPR